MKIRDRIKELRRVKASELIPNPKNWRTHPIAQQDALKGILAEVGFAGAVLTRELDDGTLMLIDGHMRAEATIDQEIPVLILDVDEAESDKLLATFDPIAAMAESDPHALDALLRNVDTGSEALQKMLAKLADGAGLYQDKELVEDEVPEPPVDPITKPGDLWLLNNHRLLCGDSTKAEDVKRLMDGKKSPLLVTSPPYSDAREYGGNDLNTKKLAEFILAWSEHAEILAVNLGVIRKDNEIVEYWDDYIEAAKLCGLKMLSWNVWDRAQPWSMAQNTAMFPLEHEFIFVFGERRVSLNLTVKNKTPGTRKGITNRQKDGSLKKAEQKQVRAYRPLGSIFRSPPHIGKNIGHPAMYPVSLPAAYIEAATSEGDIVSDSFLGSGTTLIAAEQLGRKCYGMEISPAYCDVIVKRWETLTGKKASLENKNA